MRPSRIYALALALVALVAACGIQSNGRSIEGHADNDKSAYTRWVRSDGQRVQGNYADFALEPGSARCSTENIYKPAGWYVDEPVATPACHQPEGWAIALLPPTT